MEITITIPDDGPKAKALVKALEAYNARNPLLSGHQFVQKMLDQMLGSLVHSYVNISVTRVAFLERFTPEERIAISAGAQSDPALDDFRSMIDAANTVDLTHDRTTAGVRALEAGGLIQQGRAAHILSIWR